MIGMLAALAAGGAVFLFARVALGSERRWLAQRIDSHVTPRTAVEVQLPPVHVSRYARLERLLQLTEKRLHGRAWDRFSSRVERADLSFRPVELLYAATGAAIVLCVLGLVTFGGVAVVVAPLLVWAVVRTWLGARARRRLKAFEEQLPDILASLAGSLRAGHGFLQSLQAVAADSPEPARKELRRALAETRLGRPIEDALADLGRRLPSEDFVFVLTSITVQRQVGGSLAGLFETVNDVVRQRQQFARKVRALTSTGRASARLLAVLPFALLALLTAVNHSYTAPLFTTQAGRLMLLGSVVSVTLGSLVLRRIASLKGVVR